MTFSASSPGRALPLAAITRSAPRSYLSIVSSGSSRMRWSITGTTMSAVHSCCAVALRQSSGSNLRRRTSVEQRAVRRLAAVVPGDEPLATLAGVADEPFELGVVDERRGPLSLDHLGDL